MAYVSKLDTEHVHAQYLRLSLDKTGLQSHKRYHEARKNHACRQCRKRFVHPKDLRRHQKAHIAKRVSFKCPIDGCETECGRLDNLKRHVLKQHPAFDIDACNIFEFRRQGTEETGIASSVDAEGPVGMSTDRFYRSGDIRISAQRLSVSSSNLSSVSRSGLTDVYTSSD